MKLALAQINTTVGDFDGNLALLRAAYERGVAAGAELVVAPELAMTGYPPRDLLLKSGFIEGNLAALESLAQSVEGTGLVVGHVAANERQPGRPAVNAVSCCIRATLWPPGRRRCCRRTMCLMKTAILSRPNPMCRWNLTVAGSA